MYCSTADKNQQFMHIRGLQVDIRGVNLIFWFNISRKHIILGGQLPHWLKPGSVSTYNPYPIVVHMIIMHSKCKFVKLPCQYLIGNC